MEHNRRISWNELPAPSSRQGWPWTVEAQHPPSAAAALAPRISIVTPSLRQADTIERTIRSVLLQGYPDLEYIVMDGGSQDGSRDIIERYSPWLKAWASEPDRGQCHAVNKGLALGSGQIFGWLNADDWFVPGALWAIARMYHQHPNAVAWCGAGRSIDSENGVVDTFTPYLKEGGAIGQWWTDVRLPQQSCLFSADAFRRIGGLDEDLHYALDFDFFVRLSKVGSFALSNTLIGCAASNPQVKSRRNIALREAEVVKVFWKNGLPDLAAERMVHFAERSASLRMVIRRILNAKPGRYLRRLGQKVTYFCGKALRGRHPD